MAKTKWRIANIDALVKSRTSPPLVGGDKGEGDVTCWNASFITLTPALSHQGRGSNFDFQVTKIYKITITY